MGDRVRSKGHRKGFLRAIFYIDHFQRVAGPVLSPKACQPKYNKNILKPWDYFKMGLVGNHEKMVKRSSCSNI